jgi:HlyD family secretion protein
MTQNVVTYTVEVSTDNSNGKLLPYLTANVLFEVGQHKDALLVPNAALRWVPQPHQIAPDVQAEATEKGRRKDKTPGSDGAEHGTIWLRDGEFVRPVRVQVGWNDGTQTEVEAKDLSEGAEVVIGEVRRNGGDSTSNPFAPKMFGGSKQSQ